MTDKHSTDEALMTRIQFDILYWVHTHTALSRFVSTLQGSNVERKSQPNTDVSENEKTR